MYYSVVFFEDGGFARLPFEDWESFSSPPSRVEVRWEAEYGSGPVVVVAVFYPES